MNYLKELKDALVEQFLKWSCAWAGLVDDIIGILTFGYVLPSLKLNQAKRLARWRYYRDERVV